MRAEALRLGACIHLGCIRYAFGLIPFQPTTYVRKIKALLLRFGDMEREDFGWQWVRIWLLGCASICGTGSSEGQWCLAELYSEMCRRGITSYDEFEKCIGGWLWIPEIHGVLLRELSVEGCTA